MNEACKLKPLKGLTGKLGLFNNSLTPYMTAAPSPSIRLVRSRLMRGFKAFGETSPAFRLRALIGAVVVSIMAASFAAAGAKFLNDPDTLWHIKIGQDILASGSFPQFDAYSHSFTGEPWIAKEWLSQVILAMSRQIGGWNGVVLLAAGSMTLVAGQLYWALSRRIKPLYAALVAIVACSLFSDVMLARPHILVLPIVLLFFQGVWSAAQEKRAPRFWLLGVMCVWANMHASFTFGFVVAALAFLLYLYNTRDFSSPRARAWVLFGALCPIASIIHPYGVQSIWSTVTIINSEALPYVSEWRAFSAEQQKGVALVLLALLGAALSTRFRTNIIAALLVCLLLYMYLTHIRFSYLLFTLGPLALASDIAKQFPSLSCEAWVRNVGGSALGQKLARRAGLGVLLVAATLAIGAAFAQSTARWTPPGGYYPVDAIAAARTAGARGNVLNSYNFGGALIYSGERTFVDGRADRLFQGGFMDRMEKSKRVGGADILKETLAEFDIEWTILRPKDGRVLHLDGMAGWRRVYTDEFAVVHMRAPAQP